MNIMKSLMITPRNEKDFKFVKKLMDKLGYPARELNEEEMEDLGLLSAMVREREGDYVSEGEIRKALKKR